MDPGDSLYFGLLGLGFSAGYRTSFHKCSISSWWERGVVDMAGEVKSQPLAGIKLDSLPFFIRLQPD